MRSPSHLVRAFAAVAVCLLAVGAGPAATPAEALPRFTEEREAAALFFLKKHVPEVLPFLEQLKKSNQQDYQREIRQVFHVTELLADLQDDPRRHDLELKIWKAQTRATVLVTRWAMAAPGDRPGAEKELRAVARELVDLDIQVLEHKAGRLEKELGAVKGDLARLREGADKNADARFDALLEQARKRGKM